jgi:hypothetical protein
MGLSSVPFDVLNTRTRGDERARKIEKIALKHGNDPDGRSDVWRRCRGSIGYFFRDLTDGGNGAVVTRPFGIVVRPYPLRFSCSICVRLVGRAQMAPCREKDQAE